jgi:hypothetical protein
MRIYIIVIISVAFLLTSCSAPIFNSPDPTQFATNIPEQPDTEAPVTPVEPDHMPMKSDRPAGFYQVESGQPKAIANFAYPASKCAWSGVGGQVNNQPGMSVFGLYAQVRGSINGKPLLRISVSGTAKEFGPGGYRVTLADRPITSRGKLTIQLFDANGRPRSPQVPFDTYQSCKKNLVQINFIAANEATIMHMPLIMYQPEAAP